MSSRSTSNDKVVLDALFGVPVGAEDEFVNNREDADYAQEEVEGIVADDSFEDYGDEYFDDSESYEEGYEESDGDYIATPTSFSIINQTLRRAPGGQQVVDIIIDIVDVEEARGYEIEVTKL